MIREEAIKVLNKMKYPYNCKARKMIISNVDRDNEALDMAIKALSQEPCDDAVSRRDAYGCLTFNGHYDTLNEVYERLSKLPSVTQKPKYWIDKDNKLYKMPDDIPTMTIQYPTITHGDTISRTEVMKVISDFVALEKYIDKHNHITFKPLEKMINALPSVTQKSGKWINDKNDIPICSRCGYIPQYDRAIDDYEYSNYCPLCGARMVEPQESEE